MRVNEKDGKGFDDDDMYAHEFVNLEGIGIVHCWVAIYKFEGKNAGIYIGDVQMEQLPPMLGARDPATGKRIRNRRMFVEEDERKLERALQEKVKAMVRAGRFGD